MFPKCQVINRCYLCKYSGYQLITQIINNFSRFGILPPCGVTPLCQYIGRAWSWCLAWSLAVLFEGVSLLFVHGSIDTVAQSAQNRLLYRLKIGAFAALTWCKWYQLNGKKSAIIGSHTRTKKPPNPSRLSGHKKQPLNQ